MNSGSPRLIYSNEDHHSEPAETVAANDGHPTVVAPALRAKLCQSTASTPPSPRLLSRPEAAAYCGVTVETFDDYRRRGIVPGPVEGTSRWDRRLIDQYLDRASGISTAAGSSLDGWRAKRNG